MASAVENFGFLERWQTCLSNETDIDSITELKSSLATEIASKMKMNPAELAQVKNLLDRAIQMSSSNESKIAQMFIQAAKYLFEGAILVIDGHSYQGDVGTTSLKDRIQSINTRIVEQDEAKAKEEFVQLVGSVFQKRLELSKFFIYNLPQGLEAQTKQWLSALNLISIQLS